MGNYLGNAQGAEVGFYQNQKPTYNPQDGFKFKRGQREMIAKEEDLVSARVPLEYRDYCAHLLLDYQVCKFKHAPLFYKCAHEKHQLLNCQHEDYLIRMKEFERERRLRLREKRIAEKCGA